MSSGWQTFLTVVLVVAAVAFVLRKLWNAILNNKSSSSCGACGSCAAPQPIVTIEPIKRP